MAFDPEAKLNLENVINLDDFYTKAGRIGLENGPRVGKGRRTSISCEAYLARRLCLFLVHKGILLFPFSLTHQDAPDFIFQTVDGEFGLEVSEACPNADGREKAHFQKNDGVHLFGSFGGKADFGGEMPFIDTAMEIQSVIDKKATKEYIVDRVTDLLIYSNSNAAFFVNDEDDRRNVLDRLIVPVAVRTVYIYWTEYVT